MSVETAVLLLLAGLGAGAVNAVAGGGSFLALTALVVGAGLPVEVANGTNRVAILLQSGAAIWAFGDTGRGHGGLVLRLAPATLLGGLLGAQLSLELPRAVLEGVVGLAMLAMVAVVAARPQRLLRPRAAGVWAPGPRPGRADLVFFGIGVYGGFLQAGVGVMLLLALVGLAGRELVGANVPKLLLALVFTVPALGVFLAQGAVAWGPGLVLGLGSVLGGVLGARLAVRGGAELVRGVLVVVLVLSAARFLYGALTAGGLS